MKKYLGLFIVLVLVFVIGVKEIKAESGAGAPGTAPVQKRPEMKIKKEEIKDKRIELKAEMDAKKDELKLKRDEMKAGVEAKKEEMKLKREEVKAAMEIKREEIKTKREEVKQKLGDLREKIKEEKNEIKAKLKETRINLRENALKRFDGAVERINALKDKINTRVSALEVKGVDVAAAKDFIATTDAKLISAQSKITEMNTLLAKSIEELTAEDKAKLKTLVKETQTLLKEAHGALKDAIKSLKDQLKAKIEATKTEDSTSEKTESSESAQ